MCHKIAKKDIYKRGRAISVFRIVLIGVIAGIVFGLLSFLPVVGGVFAVAAIVGISIAGIALVIGLIKVLFFGV